MLTKAHAPSTRFITKDWYDLPKELREVLTKQSDAGGASGGNFSECRKASIINEMMKLKHLETKIKHCQQTTLVADDEQAKGLRIRR